jgi:methylenetetrahydrofolate reductase (NADPH)
MRALRLWSVRHAVALSRIYRGCLACLSPLRWVIPLIGRERFDRVLRPAERFSKELLFDCKMCGQCALSSTGMSCPTNCPKNMRNGPCGGVRPDGNCEVTPTMPCVWIQATNGRQRLAAVGIRSPHALGPVDFRLRGRSSWARVLAREPAPEAVSFDGPNTAGIGTGGSGGAPPPSVTRSSVHAFESACRSGHFVVTVEVAPPDSADSNVLLGRAAPFHGIVDAINITDGAGGNCHMSSVAAATVLSRNGFTTICQVSCRDRNRIGIQGDLLGAATLGIRNVLCLTGDDVSRGDHPMAKPVFDLDSVSLLRTVRRMRDAGQLASGRRLLDAPTFFIGATANPFVPPYLDRIDNLAAKVEAGAQFIQTQFCFDLTKLEQFMHVVRMRELHLRCDIIVGVGMLNSAKALARMRDIVPGVHIPDAVIARISRSADQKREGRQFLIEMIHSIAQIEGVAGVHVMGFKNEQLLADAIVESGIRGKWRADAAAPQVRQSADIEAGRVTPLMY